MTQEHPITPPEWLIEERSADRKYSFADDAKFFARWGADQELEACCEWLVAGPWFSPDGECIKDLRAARRPKPPSLKEQALAELELLRGDANAHGLGFDAPAILRALESLPD